MAVIIVQKEYPSGRGYDVKITGPGVSLQEYMEALNAFIEESLLDRRRGAVKQCAGCDTCCAERIPLTLIDIYSLQKGLLEILGVKIALVDIIKRYAYVKAEGKNIDIMLAQNFAGKCVFLDQQHKKCTIYHYRPFTCQTYICSPLSKRAAKLRERIVNAGEDQLVKWCLENMDEQELYHEVYEAEIDPADWPDTPFRDKQSYAEVQLQEICPPKFWQELGD